MLCTRQERFVANNDYVRYDRHVLQIPSLRPRRQFVKVAHLLARYHADATFEPAD